jgi:F0F1-type ATP synthase assembly protein I
MGDGKPSKRAPIGAMRLAGAGVELAATLAVACLVGYWIDRKFGTEPWGLLILAGLGIVGGLYNMVRKYVHEMFLPPSENPPTRFSGKRGNPSDKS